MRLSRYPDIFVRDWRVGIVASQCGQKEGQNKEDSSGKVS